VSSLLAQLRARLFRGQRRTAIVLSAAAGLLSKSVNFAMLFAVVPLTLPSLGAERFGVLMTILGYGALFSFVDLGIGSALIRETARSNAVDEPDRLAELLGSGFALLIALGLVFSLGLLLAAHLLPIDKVFLRLPIQYVEETRSALTVFALLFGVALPLQGLQKIYLGFQQAYLTHTASALLSIAALAALYFSPTESLTMPAIVAWVYGLPALAPLVFLPTFWSRRLRGYRPRWATTVMHSRQLLRAGSLYLMLQMGYVLGWSIDGSLSSAMLGASSAGLLAVVQRLFQLVTVPLGLLNAPLWPAYSDAAARGDQAFLRKTLQKSMLFTLMLAIMASATLVVFRDEIVNLWFGKQLLIPTALVVLAAVMATLEATGNSFAMYLNGLHVLKPQLIVAGSFVLISIPVKFSLIHLYGIEGLVASTILCYALCVVMPYATFFRRRVFSAVSKEPSHG
jgi:O-antigen/teichoic acid export membrane protein